MYFLNPKTSVIVNDYYGKQNNIQDLPPYYYRVRNCDTNMTANTPANQYQRQKLIQNTVRVYSSLYTMNLGSLSAYVKPPTTPYGGVCWNQMSDRPFPSVQKTYVPTGKNCSLNRRHTSVTSSRPGCQSPGGVGCDIKHNSYDRYLNRLKGKAPLRRGTIPPEFGAPQIPFNCAYPVYGGKLFKTNIVTGCDCFIPSESDKQSEEKIYEGVKDYNNVIASFGIGDNVYAIQTNIPINVLKNTYTKATILSIDKATGLYEILFEDGTIEEQTLAQLRFYFPCCDTNGEIISINGIDYIYNNVSGGDNAF